MLTYVQIGDHRNVRHVSYDGALQVFINRVRRVLELAQ